MSRLVIAIAPGTYTGAAVFRDRRLANTYTVTRDAMRAIDGVRAQYWMLQRIIDQGRFNAVMPEVVCIGYPQRGIRGLSRAELAVCAHLCGWVEGLALTLGYALTWSAPSDAEGFYLPAEQYPYNNAMELTAIAQALAYSARKDKEQVQA